jgi:hypothetical protein
MLGLHQLGSVTIATRGSLTNPATDTVMAALYLATASIGPSTTVYTATGEVSGTNYTAGGVVVTNANAPTTSGSSGIWTPSASITYTTVTLSTAFNCVLLYNATQGNRAIAVYTFPNQTITAGTFTLTIPANTPGTATVTLT